MRNKLIDDLERIYYYYMNICESCDYNCMKCKLCSINHKKSSYNFLCDVVSELISSIREYY